MVLAITLHSRKSCMSAPLPMNEESFLPPSLTTQLNITLQSECQQKMKQNFNKPALFSGMKEFLAFHGL